MRLLTPSGGKLTFDSGFPVALWTSDFRLVGERGGTFRGFQATPMAAIRAMIKDLTGSLSGQFEAAGGTVATYALGGPQDDRENDLSGLQPGPGRAMPLTPATLATWNGVDSGVFGFFYGVSSTPELVVKYFSDLRFTESEGISVKSLVPRESLSSERLLFSVDNVGLFRVMRSASARSLVPRHAGRRIGPVEVWKQDFEIQPGQRDVAFIAATNTAVAVLSLEAPEGEQTPDSEKERRAFDAISKITRLDWN